MSATRRPGGEPIFKPRRSQRLRQIRGEGTSVPAEMAGQDGWRRPTTGRTVRAEGRWYNWSAACGLTIAGGRRRRLLSSPVNAAFSFNLFR
jgi:hypothetical protein